MDLREWEPLYEEILSDFGFSRSDDESSARLLKALMQNADLIDDDEIRITGSVVVVGPASPSLDGIGDRTVIGAGSVVVRDIPSDCVAVGNPCRVIKRVNGKQD